MHAFLLLCLVSAGTGLLLRRRVSPTLGRLIRNLGLVALGMAVSVMGVVLLGWVNYLTGGVFAVPLFAAAGLALPFGLVVSWGRPVTRSDAP